MCFRLCIIHFDNICFIFILLLYLDMSTQGSSRSRLGRNQKVCNPVTHITRTQPTVFTSPEDVGSPEANSHHTSSSSSAVATPIEEPSLVDSEGRIIVSISPLQVFVGAVPAPSRWFRDTLCTTKHEEFWPKFKQVSAEKKEEWWIEFKGNILGPIIQMLRRRRCLTL